MRFNLNEVRPYGISDFQTNLVPVFGALYDINLLKHWQQSSFKVDNSSERVASQISSSHDILSLIWKKL